MKKKFRFILTYFKESGKFYSSGDLEIEADPLETDKNTPYMYDVILQVRKMRDNGKLPGLTGGWDCYILISDFDSAFPHLITPKE